MLLHLCCMLADTAYPNNDCVIALFKNPPNGLMSALEELFNDLLSPPRASIEWGYKEVVTNCAFVDYRKDLKFLKQDLEAIWHMAVWLTNLKTCANEGNQISAYFDCTPPTLEEYIANCFST